jgi:hypothetical protein
MKVLEEIGKGFLAAIGGTLLALTWLLLLGGWHQILRALDWYLDWTSKGLTTTTGTVTIGIALSLVALLGLFLYHQIAYRRLLERVARDALNAKDQAEISWVKLCDAMELADETVKRFRR